MFQLLAMVLAAASIADFSGSVAADNLPQLFAATCLDGGARLPAGSLVSSNIRDLPLSLSKKLGVPSSGDVWRINGPGRSYLYILNYNPAAGVSPKICGLASDQMNMTAAADMLDLRLTGSIYRMKRATTQWIRAEDGYTATATTAGDMRVMQVNWLNDAERQQMLQDFRSVSR